MSGEEKNETKNSPTEMSPQEDGTKVLLKEDTDGAQAEVQQAKFVANPNGEAKIDIGGQPEFAGLTKEELMKYSTDPFWIRLRWFLFILFWIGWLAMLVMAIVIIVRAPGCDPPPTLLWVEEKPLVELDPANLPSDVDLLKKVEELGKVSVYLPNLINEDDFSFTTYNAEAIINVLKDKEEVNVVTDLPSRILRINPLYDNFTQNDLIDNFGNFDYSKSLLPKLFAESILNSWIVKGIKGFLMADVGTPETKKFVENLNIVLEDDEMDGVVGSNIEDFTPSSDFKEYLWEHTGNWTFYKYKAGYEATSLTSEDDLRLISFGLFLFEGTPILTDGLSLNSNFSSLIKELSELRTNNGIKFGVTSFANTTQSTIGFTRAYKGHPAYAVALNFNDEPEMVSFEGTPNIAELGTIELLSGLGGKLQTAASEKIELNKIELGPKEAIAIEFVAEF